jgi:methionyl-tRNA formyltransferase
MSNDSQKLKIVFMGTSSFAATVLKALIAEKYDITSVYTKPNKKVGRDQKVRRSAVKILAEESNLSIKTPEKLDGSVAEEIRFQKPDLIVVVAYGKILPHEVLKIPRLGAINVHASLLPKFRGPSPIQNTILHGEAVTGVTVMLMDEGIDTGEILAQKEIEINPNETYPELSQKLAVLSTELLKKTISQWVEGKIKPKMQDNTGSLICQLIEREDGKVIWDDEAQDIYNRYRAFTPWPGLFTFWEKNGVYLRLKLNKISLMSQNTFESHHIGEAFLLDDNVGVQTSSGVIVLEEIQLEGKNNVKTEEFLRGAPDFIGSILK